MARPLVRPGTIAPKSLAGSLLDFFTAPFLEQFRRCPELVEGVCFYLESFPELITLTHAVSTAMRYFKSSGHT